MRWPCTRHLPNSILHKPTNIRLGIFPARHKRRRRGNRGSMVRQHRNFTCHNFNKTIDMQQGNWMAYWGGCGHGIAKRYMNAPFFRDSQIRVFGCLTQMRIRDGGMRTIRFCGYMGKVRCLTCFEISPTEVVALSWSGEVCPSVRMGIPAFCRY